MVVIKVEWQCATCKKPLTQCDVINQANWKKDTYVCKNWHLNFKKFEPRIWKPNVFTPSLAAFLLRNGFTRYEEEKSYINDLGHEIRLNYKKREFIFTYADWTEKFFTRQADLLFFIKTLLQHGKKM